MKALVCGILLLVGVTATAQDDAGAKKEADAKRADIRHLMKVTGAGDIGKQVAMQLMGQFKATNPNIPQKFWDEFAKELSADELVELTVPAYEKHLSHDDIKALIEFYESPVGKKLVKVQPLIMQDSMMAGQRWGRELSQKVIEKMAAEGFGPGAAKTPAR